ncbi:MAG: HEPN domain-containing protein [Nanoarchaeota archaeon]|nr:HEPN domain-containing protein [Nanoarchaeota archaeon]MBU1103260.1 HEPN domain-containing protein [Nanoarchaeota archaeon]
MPVKERLKECFKEGEKGGERHKGLRKTEITRDKIKGHVNKANRNFYAISAFKEIGYSDWSASAAFYSLYHLLLAVLAKNGIQSRNQNCTFAFIESLIDEKKISLTKNDLKEIFDKKLKEDLEHSDKILDLRESIQYSTKTSMEDKEFEDMKRRTKLLLDKIKRDIEAE